MGAKAMVITGGDLKETNDYVSMRGSDGVMGADLEQPLGLSRAVPTERGARLRQRSLADWLEARK